jgi:hypothetical protein
MIGSFTSLMILNADYAFLALILPLWPFVPVCTFMGEGGMDS